MSLRKKNTKRKHSAQRTFALWTVVRITIGPGPSVLDARLSTRLISARICSAVLPSLLNPSITSSWFQFNIFGG